MPMTRSGGKPDASRATWHIASSGLVTMIRTASGETLAARGHDRADDARVLGQQVVAAHARLARQAGGDHDDVGAGRVRVVVGAHDPHVVAHDRRRLRHVQRLALGQALDDVDEDDVREPRLSDALRGGRADVAGADDGDLGMGHGTWRLLGFVMAERRRVGPRAPSG